MLDKIDLKTKISKEAYAEKIAEEENRLGFLQRTVRDAKIPVIVLFEGFRASWRSQLISKVIHALDPRGFRVYSASKTTENRRRARSSSSSGRSCHRPGRSASITGPGISCGTNMQWGIRTRLPNGTM